MPKQKTPSTPPPKTKPRRRGYRGYGSPLGRKGEGYGGAVHWGRGFTGVGFPGEGGSLLPPTGELTSQGHRAKEPRKNSSKKSPSKK